MKFEPVTMHKVWHECRDHNESGLNRARPTSHAPIRGKFGGSVSIGFGVGLSVGFDSASIGFGVGLSVGYGWPALPLIYSSGRSTFMHKITAARSGCGLTLRTWDQWSLTGDLPSLRNFRSIFCKKKKN